MAESRESTILDVKLDAGKVAQDLQDLITRIAALKAQQKELNEQIKAGNDIDGAYAEQLIRVKDQLAWTEKQAKGLSATTKLLNADTLTYSDSLNGERQKLADMQKAYDQLDRAQRESEGGKAFLEAIKAQSDAVKGLEEDTGRAQRNVGNYPKTITAVIPGFEKFTAILDKVGVSIEDFGVNAKSAFKAAGQGMSNLGKQAMKLLANPIIAAIAAVLVVLQQLYEAFQRSEAAQNAWQKTLAPFRAMWQNFQRIFDDLVKLIMQVGDAFGANGKILEYYMRNILLPFNVIIGALRMTLLNLKQEFTVLTRVFKTAFDAIQKSVQSSPLAPWFDKINNVIATVKQSFIDFGKNVREVMDKIENSNIGQFLGLAEYEKGVREVLGANSELVESNKRIAESDANLARMRRENIEKDANDTRDIAELKAKAAQKDKYNQQERLKFLEEANAKEEAIARRAYEIAKEKYEAEKLRNSLTESNAEDLEREAQAYSDMVATETAYLNKQKELAGQISELRKADVDEAKKAAAVRLEISRALQDAMIAMDTDAVSREVNTIKVAGEREVENLKSKLKELKKTDKTAREELQKLIVAKEQETQKRVNEVLTEAADKRAAALRANAYSEMELQTTDALKLAEFRKEQAEQELKSLSEMSAEKRQILYDTEEEYNAAVLDARKRLAEESLAVQEEMYNRKQLAEQNEFARELQNIQDGDAVAIAEAELAMAQKEQEELVNMDAATKSLLYKSEEEYEAAIIASENRVTAAKKKAVEEQRKMAIANANAITGAMDSLSSLLDQFGAENADAARASKAIALGKVAVETGVAIASGVAQAQSVPFPANIAAIATTVATVLANIATAVSTIKSANFNDAGKFAAGGTVPGTSYTGDKLIAHVNSGEGIYTGTQANNLLQEIANNPVRGGISEEMVAAMTAAVAAMPAPVMVLQEFRDFEQKVSTFDELTKI